MNDIKKFEKNLKGLANRRRLGIIKFLLHRKKATVAEIAKNINLSFRSTSKHLGILRQLDILANHQQGKNVFYTLEDSVPDILQGIIKRLANLKE